MTEQTTPADPGPDLDDLAAELDDDDNDPAGDDTLAEARMPARYNAGIVYGGPPPFPGKLLVTRYPDGVLLVDQLTARAWLYDFDAAGGVFRCRDDDGAPFDPARALIAADAPGWEVRAYDPQFGGDTLPGSDDDDEGPVSAGGSSDDDEPADSVRA